MPQIVSSETILFRKWKMWKISYSFRIMDFFYFTNRIPYFLIKLPRQLFFFEFIKAWKFHIVSSLGFLLCNENLNSFLTRWGNYSREETIWGNTVNGNNNITNLKKRELTQKSLEKSYFYFYMGYIECGEPILPTTNARPIVIYQMKDHVWIQRYWF